MNSTVDMINILTWNATGIMSSASYLSECLNTNKIDICGISEHWLYEKDLHFLSQLSTSYKSHTVADFDLKRPSNRRVGKGMVALMWHKRLDKFVLPLSIDDDRIIGIKFEFSRDNCIYFFQVYLPCSNHSIEIFRDYIDRLQHLLHLYSERGIVVLMGDFNTYLPAANVTGTDSRSRYFQAMLWENNISALNASESCMGAKSTFVTYDGRFESLIDYVLIPVEQVNYVTHCEILDDAALNVSRHRPIFCTLLLPLSLNDVSTNDAEHTAINWKRVTQTNINNYKNILQNNEHFQSISIDQLNSTQSIDQAYKTFVDGATVAAQKCFPLKSYKHFLKPYWSHELSGLHNKMLTYRSVWIRNGKPRGMAHPSYVQYKDAKRDFRRCHRKHANQYLQSQIDEIDRVAAFILETFIPLHRMTTLTLFFYDSVTREVRHIRNSLQNSTESASFPVISLEEVESAVKLAKCSKAGVMMDLPMSTLNMGVKFCLNFYRYFTLL